MQTFRCYSPLHKARTAAHGVNAKRNKIFMLASLRCIDGKAHSAVWPQRQAPRAPATARACDAASMKATAFSSFLARIDTADYRICRRLNRGASWSLVRKPFQIASRLGDGIACGTSSWPCCCPCFYGTAGGQAAIVMAMTRRAGRCRIVRCAESASFVRERPFIRHAGISQRGRAARSLQFSVRAHPACRVIYLAGDHAFPAARLGARAACGAHRRIARCAGAALSERCDCRRRDRSGAVSAELGLAVRRSVRVRFVSDVYFPRVNGVSTSGRTFRQDLRGLRRRDGADRPRLRARERRCGAESPMRVLRVASARVRHGAIRRIAACAGGEADGRTLERLVPRGPTFDLVHIHTPFMAHYAGVRAAQGSSRFPVSRPITPSSKNICITMCR